MLPGVCGAAYLRDRWIDSQENLYRRCFFFMRDVSLNLVFSYKKTASDRC